MDWVVCVLFPHCALNYTRHYTYDNNEMFTHTFVPLNIQSLVHRTTRQSLTCIPVCFTKYGEGFQLLHRSSQMTSRKLAVMESELLEECWASLLQEGLFTGGS